ncbi:hypothetical protein Pint_01667 [Pistacia integerrima]|uniref:Uncharacterized protein n=1 Tax=Pistacia integerrima TaxID=434235 RepID=A0ACC0ZHA1_9ROSI|nr:hypothetical protein Pint_01667 [Pistacia integerrima]
METVISCSSSPLTSQLHIFSPHKTRRNKGKTHLGSCHVRPRMSLDQPPSSSSSSSSSNPGTTLLKNVTKLLWGPSLPPGLLISTVPPASKFSLQKNPPATTNLHLYVGLPCPWAHRTLIVRALKGLEDTVPVSIASPGQDGSWEFKAIRGRGTDILVPGVDNVNGCKNLKEVYKLRVGGYTGRATVPMLWDADKKDVACNESYDIIQIFNSGLNEKSRNPSLDLAPGELKGKIEEWNKLIYPNVNNGVYRCGFAQSQEAYDRAVSDVFDTLETINDHLGGSRYLCGETLTLADVCLFTTLIRFDAVYNVLFKCTKKKLIEYPNLHGYMRDIYQMPKVAATCNFMEIMDGYYKILFPLNPGGIRPAMPSGCEHQLLSRPHNRESLSSVDNNMHVNVS